MSTDAIQWRQHPGTRKWHLWGADSTAGSLCGYAKVGGPPLPQLPGPVRACLICASLVPASATPAPTPPLVRITRRPQDQERVEVMDVEFIGGPWDGRRLHLDLVPETPTTMRVLETRYEWSHPATPNPVKESP